MNRVYSVYAIRHLATDRIYYGQTHRSVSDRWKAHLASAKRGSDTAPFVRALREHGPAAFKVTPLLTGLSRQQAVEWERDLVQRALSRGTEVFNFMHAGRNGEAVSARMQAWLAVPEQRERFLAKRSAPQSEELRAKRSASAKRMWAARSAEDRARIARNMVAGRQKRA